MIARYRETLLKSDLFNKAVLDIQQLAGTVPYNQWFQLRNIRAQVKSQVFLLPKKDPDLTVVPASPDSNRSALVNAFRTSLTY